MYIGGKRLEIGHGMNEILSFSYRKTKSPGQSTGNRIIFKCRLKCLQLHLKCTLAFFETIKNMSLHIFHEFSGFLVSVHM